MIGWVREYFHQKDLKLRKAWEQEILDHQQTLNRWINDHYMMQGSKIVAEDAKERKALRMESNVVRLF